MMCSLSHVRAKTLTNHIVFLADSYRTICHVLPGSLSGGSQQRGTETGRGKDRSTMGISENTCVIKPEWKLGFEVLALGQ